MKTLIVTLLLTALFTASCSDKHNPQVRGPRGAHNIHDPAAFGDPALHNPAGFGDPAANDPYAQQGLNTYGQQRQPAQIDSGPKKTIEEYRKVFDAPEIKNKNEVTLGESKKSASNPNQCVAAYEWSFDDKNRKIAAKCPFAYSYNDKKPRLAPCCVDFEKEDTIENKCSSVIAKLLDTTNSKYKSLQNELKLQPTLQDKLQFILSNVVKMDPALLRPNFKSETNKVSKQGHPFLDFYANNCVDKVSVYNLEKPFLAPKISAERELASEESEDSLNKRGIYTDPNDAYRATLEADEY